MSKIGVNRPLWIGLLINYGKQSSWLIDYISSYAAHWFSFIQFCCFSFFAQNSNCIFIAGIQKSSLFRIIQHLMNFLAFRFETYNLNFVQIKRDDFIGQN